MAVTGLANLAVKVADLEAACAWYGAAGATVSEPVDAVDSRTDRAAQATVGIVLLAAFVGRTRLIDNVRLP